MPTANRSGASPDSPGASGLPVRRVLHAYQQVAHQLQDLITKGGLAPGERLPAEGKMAEQFGVSRSTVREALRGLSSQNLVHTKQGVNGGTFVTEPSADQTRTYLETTIGLLSGSEAITVDELLEARELFEVPAARLAATRRTSDQLEELKSALTPDSAATGQAESGQAKPGQANLAHNFEGHRNFHVAILKASGNRLLEVITLPLFNVLRTRFLRDTASPDFWLTVDHDHEDIYAAIETADADAAARLMSEHLRRLRALYERIDRTRR